MCKANFKIHFCTCSTKQEVHTDFADEVEKLYQIKQSEATNAILNEDGSYERTYFKWTISSYKEEVNNYRVMGQMVYPQHIIGKTLTSDHILDALNSNNAFDFDYKPREKDWIKIEEKYEFIELKNHPRSRINGYISFKFENGKWEFGRYPMYYSQKQMEIGKIKTTTNKEQK